MSAVLGVPVDAAYHVVSALARLLAPLPGGLAAAAAIVVFTVAVRLLVLPLSVRATRGLEAQARLAPQLRVLYDKHSSQPDRLRRELAALREAEGVSTLGGCLPLLLQWPFLAVVYLVFRSPVIGGGRNVLLGHDLFGAALGSHWLGGAGPLSAQGAVFAGLLGLLVLVGWLTARLTRRLAASRPPAATPSAGSAAQAWLGRLAPYVTVVVAAFVPLATGLYLLTTTAWTLGERSLLGRRAHHP